LFLLSVSKNKNKKKQGQVKADHPDDHIGVFFCGPGGLSNGIRETCRNLNSRKTASSSRKGEISYFEEVFFGSDFGAKVQKKK
jgi:hypothetical protein